MLERRSWNHIIVEKATAKYRHPAERKSQLGVTDLHSPKPPISSRADADDASCGHGLSATHGGPLEAPLGRIPSPCVDRARSTSYRALWVRTDARSFITAKGQLLKLQKSDCAVQIRRSRHSRRTQAPKRRRKISHKSLLFIYLPGLPTSIRFQCLSRLDNLMAKGSRAMDIAVWGRVEETRRRRERARGQI